MISVEPYEGGEVGAFRILDADGRAYVFKLQPAGLAPQTTEVLRPLGYPVPRYVSWGDGYHVQEELPGTPAWRGWGMGGARPFVPRLLELNELQEGRGLEDGDSWLEMLRTSVTTGFRGYSITETLERRSDESRELLRLCRRAVGRYAAAVRPARDVVHWDFTLSNVLVEDGRVSGVIDWGGTRTGDRLFDLATLVYYAKGEAPELERHVVERIGDEGLSVYLAHMCVRQSDWSLRRHGLEHGDEVVAYSLGLARRFP